MSVDLSTRISAKFDELWQAGADPELAGVAAARACQQALSAAGVGLCLLQPPWRAPIGASNPDAVLAESWQLTGGDGPCLLAHDRQRPVRATAALLNRQWPALAGQLIAATSFRAVLASPLTGWLAGLGTMGVYFAVDDDMASLGSDDVSTALDTVALILAGVLGPHSAHPWLLEAPTNQVRHQTVVATGMLVAHLGLSYPDALDTLRGYALRTGRDIDSVAADLINRTLHGGDLTAHVATSRTTGICATTSIEP